MTQVPGYPQPFVAVIFHPNFFYDTRRLYCFFSLCCHRLCVSSFGSFTVSRFPIQFLLLPLKFLFLCWNPVLTWFLRAAPHVVCGGGTGDLGWFGGVFGLVHVFIWACSLTWQPNSRFRIRFRLLFPQGAEEPSSAYHPWIGTRNGDFGLTVYPPLYLQKGFFPFLCHELTKLIEHD